MLYVLCPRSPRSPMPTEPYALWRIVPHLSEKGYMFAYLSKLGELSGWSSGYSTGRYST